MRRPFYLTAHHIPTLSIEALIHRTHKYVICPYYHIVSDSELPYISSLYAYRNSETFCQDLDFLQTHFRAIHWYEIAEAERTHTPSFCLTFDDGLKEIYTTIAPILRERSIPAICFLNSAFVDNKDFFYRFKASILINYGKQHRLSNKFIRHVSSISYNQRSQLDFIAQELNIDYEQIFSYWSPYLSSEQIKHLQGLDIEFGGHSIDHPHFAELTNTEQHRQVFECMNKLTQMFKLPHQLFSFPFNQNGVNPSVIDSINQCMHYTFGTNNLSTDRWNIHNRIWMEGYNQFSAEDIIKGEYLRELLTQHIS